MQSESAVAVEVSPVDSLLEVRAQLRSIAEVLPHVLSPKPVREAKKETKTKTKKKRKHERQEKAHRRSFSLEQSLDEPPGPVITQQTAPPPPLPAAIVKKPSTAPDGASRRLLEV
jgi:hypothetical protein